MPEPPQPRWGLKCRACAAINCLENLETSPRAYWTRPGMVFTCKCQFCGAVEQYRAEELIRPGVSSAK